MSVPLDRLYNFLYDIANRSDLLIYQFLPHGSRKLEDLKLQNPVMDNASWLKMIFRPCMIFHDQEPLMYTLYTKNNIANYLKNKKHKFFPDALIDYYSGLHLRVCLDAIANVFDQTLLCHSEKNSHDLQLYEQNQFIGVYYWSHAIISRDWYRYAEHDPKLAVNFENITHDFLIYNRAWSGTREYRLTLAELLLNNDLISCCQTKFSPIDNRVYYHQHKFANPSLAISRDDLHQFYSHNIHPASASADYCSEDYITSGIEVVLETLFDDRRHHLTEKTLRPIACGRPFMLVSTPGSLQFLKNYGFETFSGLIDETYDSIIDPRLRLEAIVKEINRISKLSVEQKKMFWEKLYAIAKRNKKLFFSIKWQNSIVKEFKDNFMFAMGQLTMSGQIPSTVDRIASTNDPQMLRWRNHTHNTGEITAHERLKFTQWLQGKNHHI